MKWSKAFFLSMTVTLFLGSGFGESVMAADSLYDYWLNTVGLRPQTEAPGSSFEAEVADRERLKGHGSSDMPIWGKIKSGDRIQVRKIDDRTWRIEHAKTGKSADLTVTPPKENIP